LLRRLSPAVLLLAAPLSLCPVFVTFLPLSVYVINGRMNAFKSVKELDMKGAKVTVPHPA
jgi:hypothetical protein